jgi:hypothetical protein
MIKNALRAKLDYAQGKVAVPIILYFLGVPGFFCVLLWLIFFRGK